MTQLITLLTDFGTADGYVGEMKGELLRTLPTASIIDVSHELLAHDVDAARLSLARYWRRFPEGTVHMVVVDPGVGSERAALAVQSGGYSLVGPDNGVLSPALLAGGARCVSLPVPERAAPTFHGRDVFAPAAARLAAGASLESLGATFTHPSIKRTPEPRKQADGTILGEVLLLDRFGNAVTNIVGVRAGEVHLPGRTIMIRRTYADVPAGEPLALVGSSGLLEIAVREGSAARLLQLERGMTIRVASPE